jgi:hypothetical protein
MFDPSVVVKPDVPMPTLGPLNVPVVADMLELKVAAPATLKLPLASILACSTYV